MNTAPWLREEAEGKGCRVLAPQCLIPLPRSPLKFHPPLPLPTFICFSFFMIPSVSALHSSFIHHMVLSTNNHSNRSRTSFFHMFGGAINKKSDLLNYLKYAGGYEKQQRIYMIIRVEVRNGNKRNGKHVRCAHNNPQGDHVPDYAPYPAIVLKVEDGTGILLPITVCIWIF
uniref:Uncharacterized protein n=1 Tax=Lactuca sativa TaxID=4236 RepID=A0A9R1VN96_LACSA|nr:hypothetical protein LSAT_V11C400166440 [Lactuca sativa]